MQFTTGFESIGVGGNPTTSFFKAREVVMVVASFVSILTVPIIVQNLLGLCLQLLIREPLLWLVRELRLPLAQ